MGDDLVDTGDERRQRPFTDRVELRSESVRERRPDAGETYVRVEGDARRQRLERPAQVVARRPKVALELFDVVGDVVQRPSVVGDLVGVAAGGVARRSRPSVGGPAPVGGDLGKTRVGYDFRYDADVPEYRADDGVRRRRGDGG